MRKRLATVVIGLGLLASPAFSATATAQPPDPSDPNCHGKAVVLILHEIGAPLDLHGLGNIAKAANLSVKEIQEDIREFCAMA